MLVGELWPLNRSIELRNSDRNRLQLVQNWTHNDHERFMTGKWLEIACFPASVFSPIRVVLPRFSRKKRIGQLSPQSPNPSFHYPPTGPGRQEHASDVVLQACKAATKFVVHQPITAWNWGAKKSELQILRSLIQCLNWAIKMCSGGLYQNVGFQRVPIQGSTSPVQHIQKLSAPCPLFPCY